MNKLIAIFSVAVVIAGCSKGPEPTEAEIFGYKGQDLVDPEDKMYFTTGRGVTNWVPTRLLAVFEQYELTTNETALIEAAGVIMPSSSFTKAPEGYVQKSKEPWFVNWTKDTVAFGKSGVCGFISHFNADQGVWDSGETFFSTYYESETNAVKALNELEAQISMFGPKKIHRFDNCFIAEYLRLRVMGLAGLRADGAWTCMLSINDKCNAGCGQWEPVDQQQERVDELAYRAAVKAWRETVSMLAKRNHATVLARCKASGIGLFGDDVNPQPTGDGRMVYVVSGAYPMSNAVPQTVWDDKLAEIRKATAVVFSPVDKRDVSGEYQVWSAFGTNELFDARIDIAFPNPSTNSVAEAAVEWRQICFENILPGNEPPPAPQRKK